MNLDEQIAEGLREGSKKAFELLYDNYYAKLCSFSYKVTKDIAVSEEIVQDLILTIWEKKETLSFAPQLKYYLYRAVHNNSVRYVNKHAKVYHNSEETEALENVAEEFSSTMEETELSMAISLAVESLPAQTNKIFKMSREENLTYKEIAEKTNLSVKSIEYHISKAINYLHSELKEFLTILIILFFF